MAQYADAKRQYPDALVFFRMGDFYEMFHDDAELASRELGLTLTARDRERKIPMAGVPVRAADAYLRRLLARGHKVAVCEQVSDPATTKGVLDREVVRVLTPGTLTEDESLEPKHSNYLLAVRPARTKRKGARAGLAWVDLSTGRFFACEVTPATVLDEIARIQPAEVLLPENEIDPAWTSELEEALRVQITFVPAWTLEPKSAAAALRDHFGVASLKAYGLDKAPMAQAAAGGALGYLQSTQMTALAHVTRIERRDPAGTLVMDHTTRRRLDLVSRIDGTTEGTLVSVLDRTKTAMGGRLLREWMLSPLCERAAIEHRLDGVGEFAKDGFLRRDIRDALGAVRDVERILARVATLRANGRDLQALGRSLEPLAPLRGMLESAYTPCLTAVRDRVGDFSELAATLARAFDDEIPPTITEGGLFRAGWSDELDELRNLRNNAREWIANYQATESERTGIPSLKIGYNKVFGYYIEVTHAHTSKVPSDYTRKQTLRNAERYVTPELNEYEQKVLRADDQAKALERTLFLSLRDDVADQISPLQATAAALAELDALAGLAEVAATSDYVRPELRDDRTLHIVEGRHPVVETTLQGAERFVPNDNDLNDEQRVALITGPNMAGKSTYIRQTALLVLMAQMGSFVPASKAQVGVVDRIFARVGAEDDLTRGQSTFMVEMSETAYILHHATDRSLVILDEVGRGTSTFDGIAIAWSITEYLSEVVGARTLFATHYHELTRLADELAPVFNLNVAVREWDDRVVFLRRIVPGATDRSYGIHVAQLAGVPEAVVERSRAVLRALESDREHTVDRVAFGVTPPQSAEVQLGLFAPAPPHPVVEALRALAVEELTPLEALNRLAEFKEQLGEGGG